MASAWPRWPCMMGRACSQVCSEQLDNGNPNGLHCICQRTGLLVGGLPSQHPPHTGPGPAVRGTVDCGQGTCGAPQWVTCGPGLDPDQAQQLQPQGPRPPPPPPWEQEVGLGRGSTLLPSHPLPGWESRGCQAPSAQRAVRGSDLQPWPLELEGGGSEPSAVRPSFPTPLTASLSPRLL